MRPEPVVYVGVFLAPDSRERLLAAVPPIHPYVIADHMTVLFRPTALELSNIPLARVVTLEVTGVADDEQAQAVLVAGVLSANLHPHITISVNRDKGGSPRYSNDLLRRGHRKFSGDLRLEGVIDTYPPSPWRRS